MRGIILTLSMALLLLSPAAAQEADQTTNWPVTCQSAARTEPLVCVASTVAYRRDSGQKMVEVRLVATPEQPNRLEIIGPFGTSVDQPFRLKAGEADIASARVSTCEQDGCHALVDMTDAMQSDLASAQSLTVVFSTPAQGAVEVPLPTLGLAAALRAIAP